MCRTRLAGKGPGGREGRCPARMAAGDDDFAGWASGEHRGEALRWGFASFAPRPLVFGPQPGGSSSVGPVPSPPPPPWPYLVSRRGPLAQASSLPGETASWRLFPVPYTRRSVRGSPGAALLRSILCFPRPDLGTGRDSVGAPSGEVVRCAAGLVLSIPSQPGLGGD